MLVDIRYIQVITIRMFNILFINFSSVSYNWKMFYH